MHAKEQKCSKRIKSIRTNNDNVKVREIRELQQNKIVIKGSDTNVDNLLQTEDSKIGRTIDTGECLALIHRLSR